MKKYPAYKDSERESIGIIPSDWNIIRLKFCSDLINGYAFSSDSYVEDGVPIIRIGDIKPLIDLSETKKVPKEFLKSHCSFMIQYGDVLLALTGATIGKMAVYNIQDEVLLNQRVAIIRPKEDSSNGFLKYIIGSQLFKNHIDYECVGGAQDNIGKPEIGEFIVVLPPPSEQRFIEKFLDHKTHLIDTFIEKKQKQVELLQEQRTAIINQAVTKGLNPNVKMKDSGIEWFGEVPKHWMITRVKFLSNIISKGTTPTTMGGEIIESGDIRFLKAENIIKNKVSAQPEFFIDSETDELLKRSKLKEHDVLLVIAGATIGKVAILGFDLLPANTNQAVSFIRLADTDNSKFLWYWLQSSRIQENIWLEAVQSAQPNIAMGDLGNLLVPSLPKNERNEIIEFLDAQTACIDNLILMAEKEIGMLGEYRTTLISDVVTGKIDVRDEVIP